MDGPPEIAALTRPATVAQIGGFRPPDDPWSSWIGRVAFGEPPPEGLAPLLQLVTAELPVVPDAFAGAALVTVFVAPDRPPHGEDGIAVRTYARREDAPPLDVPLDGPWRPFPLRFGARFVDWPTREEVPWELLAAWDEAFGEEREGFTARDGLKVGGCPRTLQSELSWGGPTGTVAADFVLQVDDHDAKAQFGYVSGDITYLGRRRADGVWVADWQST